MRNFFKNQKETITTIPPYVIFVTPNFSLKTLQDAITVFLKEHTKSPHHALECNNELLIKTELVENPKKQKTTYTLYSILHKNNLLHISCTDIMAEGEKKEENPVALHGKKNALLSLIIDHTTTPMQDQLYAIQSAAKIPFMTSVSNLEENFLLAHRKADEIFLVRLGITNLESKVFKVDKKQHYFLVLTSQRTLIFGTDGRHFLLHDITEAPLLLEQKIGKDAISSQQINFDTELFNDNLFVNIKPLLNTVPDNRIALYAAILFDQLPTKESKLAYIQALYRYQISSESHLSRELKAQLTPQFVKKKCSPILILGPSFTELMYSTTDFGNVLFQIMEEWAISAKEQYAFLELITAGHEQFKLKYLAVFYDSAIAGIAN